MVKKLEYVLQVRIRYIYPDMIVSDYDTTTVLEPTVLYHELSYIWWQSW